MSDFGTLLSAAKKNGEAISSDERSLLSNALEAIIKENDFEDLMGKPFQHQFEESGGLEVIVQLSEHYFGDEEPKESMEFVEENELDDAKDLVVQMNTRFSEMTFTASIEQW